MTAITQEYAPGRFARVIAGPIAFREAWDAAVMRLPISSPYQRAGWIEACAEASGGIPIFINDSTFRFFAGAIYISSKETPELYVTRGPAGIDPLAIAQAALAIRHSFPRAIIRMEPCLIRDDAGKDLEERLIRDGFRRDVVPFHGATVRITLDDEVAMWNRMSKTVKLQIKRAQRAGVRIEEDVSVASARKFYDFWSPFIESRGVHDHDPLKFFLCQVEPFVRDRLGTMLFTYVKDRLCSAALLLYGGWLAWLSRAPSCLEGEPFGAFLQWEAMLRAKQRGCKVYDLGGVAVTDDGDPVNTGLTRFKLSLGGQLISTVRDFVLHP